MFQCCMLSIFADMIEDSIEVLMDDFLMVVNSFVSCVNYLNKELERCMETNLVLSWKKCHFMVKKGIMFGHKILGKRIQVDLEKVEVIAKFPPLSL